MRASDNSVHDFHKYFDKISVSVVCVVCPTCRYLSPMYRFCMRFSVLGEFFAVLQLWMISSSVLRFLIYLNALLKENSIKSQIKP